MQNKKKKRKRKKLHFIAKQWVLPHVAELDPSDIWPVHSDSNSKNYTPGPV